MLLLGILLLTARVPVKKPTPAQVKVMEIAKQLSKDLNTDSDNSPQIKFRKSSSTNPEPNVISQNFDSDISEISSPRSPLHSRLYEGANNIPRSSILFAEKLGTLPVSSMTHGTTPKSPAVVNDLTDLKTSTATPTRSNAATYVTTPKTPAAAINKVMTPKTPVQGTTTPKSNKQQLLPASAMFITPSKPRAAASTAVTSAVSSPCAPSVASQTSTAVTAASHSITPGMLSKQELMVF